jgi:hypothetical protein
MIAAAESRPSPVDCLPFVLHNKGGFKCLEYHTDAGVGVGKQSFLWWDYENEGLFKTVLSLMEQYRQLERSVGGLEKELEREREEKEGLKAEIHRKDAKIAEQERRLGRPKKGELT